MNSESFRRLASARVRLVRQTDGEILNGWMVQMTASRLKVAILEPNVGEIGEEYIVEVHGPSVRLVLNAKLMVSGKSPAEFEVGRDIKFMPASEPARVMVDGISVHCHWDGKELVGRVSNISREGLCMVLQGDVLVGSTVDMEVHYESEIYQLRGTIRYCVEDSDPIGAHRLGVQLEAPGARWLGLFDEVAEAA